MRHNSCSDRKMARCKGRGIGGTGSKGQRFLREPGKLHTGVGNTTRRAEKAQENEAKGEQKWGGEEGGARPWEVAESCL